MKHLAYVLLLGAAACGTDNVDAAGNYTAAITNKDNGCNFQNWQVGNQSTGIAVTITQSSNNATASVSGVAGAYLDVVFASHAFTGHVDGDKLDLTLVGTRAGTTGNCTYTYNGEMIATLNGDALSGKINYTPQTNNQSDCASIKGCLSFQEFNATRPPK